MEKTLLASGMASLQRTSMQATLASSHSVAAAASICTCVAAAVLLPRILIGCNSCPAGLHKLQGMVRSFGCQQLVPSEHVDAVAETCSAACKQSGQVHNTL